MRRIRNLCLAGLFLLGLCFSVQTTQAQTNTPGYCELVPVFLDREASEHAVSNILYDLGYSTARGPGASVYGRSQRLVGWLVLLYSTGDPAWRGSAGAYQDLAALVQGLIRENDGMVPALAEEDVPQFREAIYRCDRPRGRET